MDFFKLGLRNILGISIPGSIIILVFSYTLIVILSCYNQNAGLEEWVKDSGFLIFVVLFVLSYIIGNIIRVSSAESLGNKARNYYLKKKSLDLAIGISWLIDNNSLVRKEIENIIENPGCRLCLSVHKIILSVKYRLLLILSKINKFLCNNKKQKDNEYTKDKKAKILLYKIYHKEIIDILLREVKSEIKNNTSILWYSKFKISRTEDISEWFLDIDDFPYNLWSLHKFHTYYPGAFSNFYVQYKECMANERNSVFFNYCKNFIFSLSKEKGDDLKEEVLHYETNTRFYAGTFKAFSISIWMLIFCGIVPIIKGLSDATFDLSLSQHPWPAINFFLAMIIAAVMGIVNRNILINYRNRRLKEVATVYDAFYLVNR
jgi:hypothetical protein